MFMAVDLDLPVGVADEVVLAEVTVRLITEAERAEFDRLLAQEHYLHQADIPGRTLRYVAEFRGQWVGLLVFSSAALHVKAREKAIGWSPRQRARRLDFVVNNSRFLVRLPAQRCPNLASRILGLCLRRLADDWLAVWQQPLLLVESFVDESVYRGTCYRACGFAAIGASGGFQRHSRDFYLPHDRPKQLYLRELRPGGRRLLGQARWPEALAAYERETVGHCPFQAAALGQLLDRFQGLRDGRQGHGLQHRQTFVLACAAIATLMGSCGYQAFADTCGKFTQRQLRALGAPRGKDGRYRAPSDSTFLRVLHRVDATALATLIGQWLREQEPAAVARLAVDGKVLRGSGRTDGRPMQLLSAVTHHLRLTLDQVAIAEKSNEIPALQPLLKKVAPPPGVLITADALHCQQESARCITQDYGGDYLFGLKGNQSGALESAQRLLAQQSFSPLE